MYYFSALLFLKAVINYRANKKKKNKILKYFVLILSISKIWSNNYIWKKKQKWNKTENTKCQHEMLELCFHDKDQNRYITEFHRSMYKKKES